MPERRPDDCLTAQDIAEQYGINPVVARNIVRRAGRAGLRVYVPGFKRTLVRRQDVEPRMRSQESGGTTCE